MKDYREPYSTPYYDGLKRNGIHLPCFLTHIRTDGGEDREAQGCEDVPHDVSYPTN